ncbi:MAG: sporulation protein YabP [Lachnospiraceae bacterium]|jgi:sporulation protein YabP|nr:sporulation protein YabP [Lachnospiraceae bacterium]MCX4315667.1 sporulation protein YabP [Lachnospiraceae bacterium]
MEERNPALHRVSMTGRRAAILTGVEDVLSFDEHEILLQTTEGVLTIKGEDLHVNRLSVEKGEIDMEGRITSLSYSDKDGFRQNGESLFGRLFR